MKLALGSNFLKNEEHNRFLVLLIFHQPNLHCFSKKWFFKDFADCCVKFSFRTAPFLVACLLLQ